MKYFILPDKYGKMADHDDTAGVRGTHVVCLAQWSVLLPGFKHDDTNHRLPRVLLNFSIISLFI